MRLIKKKVVHLLLVCAVVFGLFGASAPVKAAGYATTPPLGQISLFPYGKAPTGWAECDGRTLLIKQNSALYSLIGTTFGGDGVTTFQLPNLTNKAPVIGTKYYIAVQGIYGIDGADPTLGEVVLLPDSIVRNSTMWKLCDGSSLNIANYSVLFSLIGNSYGGDSSNGNFLVPNLTAKSPISGLHYYIAVEGLPPSNGDIATEEFLGVINLYAFTLYSASPGNFLYCNGQTLSSGQSEALFNLIGTTFGGTSSNFAVPNLVGKAPSLKMKYYISTIGIYPSF